ncbi:patatin-like phospholipase family protein [Luteibacter yeojuensis]|uniref:Patatin-like phospholipase family protein n=1 Tax=Luteibacter yeojuensis TaxID=345309 RepID=A0A7X5QWZ9_9GAMM|nr:patatin-like phospholipase family protein [Luteibacter yeojuensis]NID16911.1 patatin-like phospholipase family protein [Luteibacter yeojuensis]
MRGGVQDVGAYNFDETKTLVFSGGGNRCWWQAGAVRRLLDHGLALPGQLVGTSAGAAVAASFLAQGDGTALEACLRLFAGNPRIFDWSGLARLTLKFAHQEVYPAWIDAFISTKTFDTLRHASSRLVVGLTRPARLLGTGGSVVAGTLAYLFDRYLWNSIHPRLPARMGLRQDFMVLNDCADIESAQSLLVAAASAPPFMSARHVGGAHAIDGGYTDNAPIPRQSDGERAGTLVLLTRHYPALPMLFKWEGRTYWQPSRRIPVSTWDCSPGTTVRDAYALGAQDAAFFLSHKVADG